MAIEFWKGTNGIGAAKQADLSISAILPGGLLVRDNGDVWAGSADTGDAVAVEMAGASDYTTWTDKTGSHPTGGRVTKLIEV